MSDVYILTKGEKNINVGKNENTITRVSFTEKKNIIPQFLGMEKDVFRLVTSVGQRKNSESP